jgi:diguanylate cyclase (GGDEF)-like protein
MIFLGILSTLLLVTAAILAMVLVRTLRREKVLVRFDELTGVLNPAAFRELAEMESLRGRRYKHPFTLVSLDIDEFRMINDRYGRSVGDAVLRLVARTIQETIRQVDLVARMGGDEFSILLPETAYEPAKFALRRIQESLRAAVEKNNWPITFSLGAATFISPPESVDGLIQVTDRLLAAVKRKGKDGLLHESWEKTESAIKQAGV